MERIKELLEKRRNYLLQLEKEKEEGLKNAPEGFLRISNGRNKAQYYHRTNPKDFSGEYICEKDINLAKELAQKAYDKKVMDSAKKELKAINEYFLKCPKVQAEQVYEKLHGERRKLIEPIQETEEEYVTKWRSVKYQGKEFEEGYPEIYTSKGERVRSKSEVIIADYLNKNGIPYRYECPVKIKGWGKFYPDFTALNVRERKEIYWEHLGMMDDITYMENALQKLTLYMQNGISFNNNLIITYETKKHPLNLRIIKLMIEQYLM